MTIGCVGAFGSGPFGSMPFGSGFALAISEARQDTLNSVRVTFNTPPRANDPGDIHDVLDVALWTLTALGGARARLVQYVVRLSELSVRVYFDGTLTPFALYEISLAATARSASGGSLGDCASWQFGTLGWPLHLVPSPGTVPRNVDIANPFMPKDAPSPDAALGTYQIAGTGDWLNDSGRTGLRKRCFRVLTTPEGGFYHLPFLGAAPDLEQPIRADDLRRIASQAKRGLMAQPDVTDARVTAAQSPTSPFIVQIRAVVTDIYGGTETVAADVTPRRG